MKLRIRGNSVRIRLSQSEVARLGRDETIEQTTEFSAGAEFVSRVESSASMEVPGATFDGACVCISIPRAMARLWANSEQVSIEATQAISADRELNILIEKDFECLHSKEEGNSDAFPNPRNKKP